jgi:hypothetical protein
VFSERSIRAHLIPISDVVTRWLSRSVALLYQFGPSFVHTEVLHSSVVGNVGLDQAFLAPKYIIDAQIYIREYGSSTLVIQ